MYSTLHRPVTVLSFWFERTDPALWWAKSEEFDQLIRARFSAVHCVAQRCELDGWRSTAPGRLAEIIVLDQFSRNLYRDQPQAFACDALALALAQVAVAAQADLELDLRRRVFFYLPYMHSESRVVHVAAQRLFSVPGLEDSLRFELKHRAIIDRFGRYPHRNAILGRISTAEELEFLATPGSSF